MYGKNQIVIPQYSLLQILKENYVSPEGLFNIFCIFISIIQNLWVSVVFVTIYSIIQLAGISQSQKQCY